MTPFERLTKSNTKENLWIYILAALKKHSNYAWDLHSSIEKDFGFKPGNITPYRVLYRLEELGLVSSETEDRRRVYKITETGEKELNRVKGYYLEILKKIS